MLVYALATELFAPSSPTVLYSEACDKIKASPEVRPFYTLHDRFLIMLSRSIVDSKAPPFASPIPRQPPLIGSTST